MSDTEESYQYEYEDEDTSYCGDDMDYNYEDDEEEEVDLITKKGGGGYTSVIDTSVPSTTNEYNKVVMTTMHGNPPIISKLFQSKVNDVTEALSIPQNAAIVLLRKLQWDTAKVLQLFIEDDKEKVDETLENYGVLAQCGRKRPPTPAVHSNWLKGRDNCQVVPQSPTKKQKQSTFQCDICFDDEFTSDQMYSMDCQHSFCIDCWKEYLNTSLLDKTSTPIEILSKTCPHLKCREIISQSEVQFHTPQLLPKYQNCQLSCFVEECNAFRFCPGPNCDQIAHIPNSLQSPTSRNRGNNVIKGGANSVATCTECSTSFCYACGSEPHAPLTCHQLGQWNEKCEDESETANWITVNTKACPKCSARIEKNQGCNHMTCRACNHHFCWLCMCDWEKHGYNSSCNKFEADQEKAKSEANSKVRNDLERYLHYYTRYHGHHDGQKFAKKQLKDTEVKMEQMRGSNWAKGIACTEVDFLKSANEELIWCRRVLKYTYSFAYHFFDPHGNTDDDDNNRQVQQPSQRCFSSEFLMQKERFEYHQEMLEKFTEKLSELVEKPQDKIDRIEVVNHATVVSTFRKNVLKYVEDEMNV